MWTNHGQRRGENLAELMLEMGKLSRRPMETTASVSEASISAGWEVVWNNCEEAALEGDIRILTWDQGTAPGELRQQLSLNLLLTRYAAGTSGCPLGPVTSTWSTSRLGAAKRQELGLQEILG